MIMQEKLDSFTPALAGVLIDLTFFNIFSILPDKYVENREANMGFNDSDYEEGRNILKRIEEQPTRFVFGIPKAIRNTVLSLATKVPRDSKSGKEWAQAHVYLLDKPGRGKTAVLIYLSHAIRAKIGRVDGRPDMMPSDITGREERFTGTPTLLKGPLHSNIFFFDEINRTPPKGQAIMLGAMEGGYVIMMVTDPGTNRLDAKPFSLYPISEDPDEKELFFTVFATANPIEFEGTYPLSEAQKERFTYSFRMGRPNREDEMRVRSKNVMGKKVDVVTDLKTILQIQEMAQQIELSEGADELIMRYIENSVPYPQDLEDWDRPRKRHASMDLVYFIKRYVLNGCSVRRNFHMEAAAKAWAFLRGENRVATADDVKAIAPLTMEHVILLDPKSEGDNVTTQKVVQKITDETEMP